MNTKNKIFEYLSVHGSGTVDQLSRYIGVTKADIRYHLSKLITNDLVVATNTRYQNGSGRPAVVFSVQEKVPEKFLMILTSSLLELLISESGGGSQQKDQIAIHLVKKMLDGVPQSGSPAVALSRKIDRLREFGFEIVWIAGPRGPIFHITKEPVTPSIQNMELSSRILHFLMEVLTEKSPA